MEIREAIEKDIPEIVSVLKASLGEKELSLSEEIWKYKHIENPFGRSLVLIAEEEKKIIGVRAFMRWQWCTKGRRMSSFRAVDTATHPTHQGRGIFKKLTLTALKFAKEEGAAFVFNTPNEKSRPGYLKMGWKVTGNIQVGIKPALNSFWKIFKKIPDYQINYEASSVIIENLCSKWNGKLNDDKIYTEKSADYLKWRYENNPLRSYEVLATANFYIAGYIQVHRGIKELRIVESIYLDDIGKNELLHCIRSWSSKFGVQVVSFSSKLLNLTHPSLRGEFGPILTIRDINLHPREMDFYSSIENWSYSLGDLELF